MKNLLLVALIALGAWYGFAHRAGGGADWTAEQISALAAGVGPGEIVMYSTTECGYCTQARGWLAQNGFAFSECNLSVETRCIREFEALGAQGTPYLVVRGHHMKNGFDSDEFLAALQGERG